MTERDREKQKDRQTERQRERGGGGGGGNAEFNDSVDKCPESKVTLQRICKCSGGKYLISSNLFQSVQYSAV